MHLRMNGSEQFDMIVNVNDREQFTNILGVFEAILTEVVLVGPPIRQKITDAGVPVFATF